MKFRIHHRLFLAFLAATAAAVLCMFLIMQWSMNRGFVRYVNTVEEERIERLAAGLEQGWAENRSWDFLQEDPGVWMRLFVMAQGGDSEEARIAIERWEGSGRPPGALLRRTLLLDAERNVVLGQARKQGEMTFRPLVVDGGTVGYLGQSQRRDLTQIHELRFVQQQKLTMALIGGVVLLVSALLSLPLAYRLVRPIKEIASATHRLAAGEYAARVPVTSSDEMGRLARDFNELALTLEKNEKARRGWVADISHELRTPLSVLRGEIEALQDGVRRPTPEALRSLHTEVMQLTRLVDDLYQLSLSDLGALTYRKSRVDLVEIVEEAVEPLRDDFARKDLQMQVRLPQEAVVVFADAARLHQLFANLLENALKYTEGPGTVKISLESGSAWATVHILDSAPGVPEEELERLFERLYRVENSRSRATGGAGLGLAICRNIVEGHAGAIEARPSPHGGVWITVKFPLMGAGA
jgi:two-component system, OmpR family, sensor histidine kinase BaeS